MHHSERDIASQHAEPSDTMKKIIAEMEAVQREQGFGATGQFPEGKIDASDEGEIKIGVAKIDGKVILNFGSPVKWVGFTPQQARQLAESLRKASHAD